MSGREEDTISDMIDNLTETLENARTVIMLNRKINEVFGDAPFSIRISVLSMVLCKTILDESDDSSEAMSYVARCAHTLVEVIDKHVKAEMRSETEEDNEEEEGTLQ